MKKNLAASIRARLLNLAKSEGSDFNSVLVRFALERFLYRLSKSAYADQFLLKGALLFGIWYDMPHRATRDADLLGFGSSDLDSIEGTFRDIASIEAHDGIVFDADSVQVSEIRETADYAGVRILIIANLSGAKCKTQIDVGFGDVVTPAPVNARFPVLLSDLPSPKIRAYPLYTVIAEKLHAITLLGMTNSRVKDYYDLAIFIEREDIETKILAAALVATFNRRGMQVPDSLPIGLTGEFANDPTRIALWKAFLNKNELDNAPLNMVVAAIVGHFEPAWSAAASTQENKNFSM